MRASYALQRELLRRQHSLPRSSRPIQQRYCDYYCANKRRARTASLPGVNVVSS